MACTSYKEHKWRKQVCSECLMAHKEHNIIISSPSKQSLKSKVSLPIDSTNVKQVIISKQKLITDTNKASEKIKNTNITKNISEKKVEKTKTVDRKIRTNRNRDSTRNRSSRTISRPLSPPPAVPKLPDATDNAHLYHEYDIGVKKVQAYEIVALDKSRPRISSPMVIAKTPASSTIQSATPATIPATTQPTYEEIPYDLAPLQKKSSLTPSAPSGDPKPRLAGKDSSPVAATSSKTSFFRRLLNAMTTSTTSLQSSASTPSSKEDAAERRRPPDARLKPTASLSDDDDDDRGSFSDSGVQRDSSTDSGGGGGRGAENTYVNDEPARAEFDRAARAVDAMICELALTRDHNCDSSDATNSLSKSSGWLPIRIVFSTEFIFICLSYKFAICNLWFVNIYIDVLLKTIFKLL